MVDRVGFLLCCVLCGTVSSAPQGDSKIEYEILSSSHSNIYTSFSPDGSQTLTVLTDVKGSDTNGQATSSQNSTYIVNNSEGNVTTTYITNNVGNTTMTYVVNNMGDITASTATERPQYFG